MSRQRRPQAQSVTPALRQWIIEQAEAGFSPEVVLQSMRASGWDEDVAIRALEQTLEAHLASRAQSVTPSSDQPIAVPVPDPDLEGSPLYLDAGDRRVAVLHSMREPRIVVFGGVLSDEECEALIEQARPRLARSLTVAPESGGEKVSAERTSQGMFFARGESALIARIEARLARLVWWPVECGEGLQILKYRPGAEYKPHYDYFEPDEPGTPTIVKRGGQRVATLIIYLAEPERGGATVFPDVRIEVAPKRGNAVFFSYDRPHPSTYTLHAGAPVLAGEKWIATKWLRQHPFD
jgi:prolyl 4-hydroxylase